ncbi:MAG: nucleotidyltransferase domain-containing protein [Anaerolineae bacterium]|jgi:uncharacterized protein
MNEPGALSRREQESIDAFVQRLHDRFGDRVRSTVLFGSKARRDAGPESDIDVLVTLADDDAQLRSDVRRLAARVSLEYDVLLSVRAVSRSQWAVLSRYRFPLYQTIAAEGIDISQ